VDTYLPEIHALLMRWDAIGIADLPYAYVEYDCMVEPLLALLREGTATATVLARVARERSEHFGLGPDAAADPALAEALVARPGSTRPD
jgi:hypothetical protein